MSLTLTTLRCPETVPPQTRRVSAGDFSIGRGLDNDWVLPDPNRHLSKRHCTLTFRGDTWHLEDTSTNGTFVNFDDAPVGQTSSRSLQDGDRLRLGMYELEVRIGVEQTTEPRVLDPAADSADDRTRMFRPLHDQASARHSAAPNLETDALETGSPFAEPVRVPIDIPEDWNSDPFDAPAASAKLEFHDGPEGSSKTGSGQDRDPSPTPLAGAPADPLAAFMRGAGLPQARPGDPEATMEALGLAFRAVVTGIRQVLLARASIKSEFRIEQTMIRARGNNPLKFSVGDDDALASLLGVGRSTDMPAAEAVRDALRDVQLHELASMAAMQAAVRSLVAQFDPEKIRAGTDQGGMALVAAQRKARAWDAFEALHERTTHALADDFDTVFGKAFAEAYEQILRESSERTESV